MAEGRYRGLKAEDPKVGGGVDLEVADIVSRDLGGPFNAHRVLAAARRQTEKLLAANDDAVRGVCAALHLKGRLELRDLQILVDGASCDVEEEDPDITVVLTTPAERSPELIRQRRELERVLALPVRSAGGSGTLEAMPGHGGGAVL